MTRSAVEFGQACKGGRPRRIVDSVFMTRALRFVAGAHIDPVCAPQPKITDQAPAAQIGGYFSLSRTQLIAGRYTARVRHQADLSARQAGEYLAQVLAELLRQGQESAVLTGELGHGPCRAGPRVSLGRRVSVVRPARCR